MSELNSGRKLINSANSCVEDAFIGIKAAYPRLSVNPELKIAMRCPEFEEDSKFVGIVSGGGSGHEPFSAGFIGRGMLNGIVAGSVFTSPPASTCLTAIHNVAEHFKGGVLVLIPNYTGDVLNFGQAVEMAKDMGHNVESVIVGEDCALLEKGVDNTVTGRRGLCGQLFCFKIAGALADSGSKLVDIAKECHEVVCNMATFGLCSAPCTLPGSSTPLFKLSADQIELGVGIHGEAGVEKLPFCSANEAARILLDKIIESIPLKKGDKVCAIVNNLGSTTTLECHILAGELNKQLENRDIQVERMYVGTLVTSLDMAGVQFSLLKTTDKPHWVSLLDSETEAAAWPGCRLSFGESAVHVQDPNLLAIELTGPTFGEQDAELLKQCLKAVCRELIEAEERLNQLDSGCGDGDCGTTFRQLADAILKNVDNLALRRPVTCFVELANIASQTMGGTSGAIYSLLLRGASRHLLDWDKAWTEAVSTVTKYSTAKIGYRTMLDALIPALNEFKKRSESDGWLTALKFAVEKAQVGCDSTKNMVARCGRASYVDRSYLKDVDAGAYAVTVCLRAIYIELQKNIVI
ncbi:triokinase/FMN cyclase [Nilaparvata lugens]|uniref:triokinase/FMN cyclase n=1 Tax=Nilaparvata lugens TaxID=108931 RepID=UPI00193C997D|nr:triokinase/FMN cyclase [Nilaparvata lugens]XP_022194081.2 triokinase/FMN cyclase [Nilaparvata lugens]